MTATRTRLLLFVAPLVGALVVVGGLLLGVNPLLGQIAETQTDRTAVEHSNTSLQRTINSLAGDAERIDEIRDDVARLNASLPNTAELNEFLNDIVVIAAGNGAALSSIDIGDPVPLTPTDDPTLNLPQLDPSHTLLSISVAIRFDGSPEQAEGVTAALQASPRLFLAHSISSGGRAAFAEPPSSWSIEGTIYVLTEAIPQTDGAPEAASETAP